MSDNCCYTEDQQRWIISLYIILLIIWFSVIFIFGLWDEPGWWILLLPPILFILGIVNLHHVTTEVEDVMISTGTLTVGLVLALPLFTCIAEKYGGNRQRFIATLVLALIFTLLTTLDIWVPVCWICVYHHLRSGLQVMGITLLIYAFSNFYLHLGVGAHP